MPQSGNWFPKGVFNFLTLVLIPQRSLYRIINFSSDP